MRPWVSSWAQKEAYIPVPLRTPKETLLFSTHQQTHSGPNLLLFLTRNSTSPDTRWQEDPVEEYWSPPMGADNTAQLWWWWSHPMLVTTCKLKKTHGRPWRKHLFFIWRRRHPLSSPDVQCLLQVLAQEPNKEEAAWLESMCLTVYGKPCITG